MYTKPHGLLLYLAVPLLAAFSLTGCFKKDISETREGYIAEAGPQETASQPESRPEPEPEPVAQPEPTAKPQPVAKADTKSTATKTPAPKAAATAKGAANTSEKIQKDLDAFAQDCLTRMNRNIRPSISTKEVVAVPEGFRARYVIVDPNSLRTSFSASENKAVTYIGRLSYHEVEYVSIGKTKAQALAGPFSEHNRRPLTELIKHMKGKWTY